MQLTPWRAIRRATAKKVTPAAVRAFFLLLELNAPTPTGLQTMKIGLLLATLISCSAMATVYSYRDADGNLVFTDEPVAGTNAVEVELSEPTVMPGFNVGNPDTAGGATQTPSEQREDGDQPRQQLDAPQLAGNATRRRGSCRTRRQLICLPPVCGAPATLWGMSCTMMVHNAWYSGCAGGFNPEWPIIIT